MEENRRTEKVHKERRERRKVKGERIRPERMSVMCKRERERERDRESKSRK